MIQIIEFLKTNVDIVRPIWFAMGIIGLWIMKKYTRPSFFLNKSNVWWMIGILYYLCMGPLVLIVSLLTLIKPDKKLKDE